VIVALGLGLRKQEQLKLWRDQVDFFRNVVVASRTKGKRNREIPMDVLDERVKSILWKLCGSKKADELVFVNPNTKEALH
jgi:serine/threonine-protein kinase RIO1